MKDRDCASTYVDLALGMIEDRLCFYNGSHIKLSAEDVLDCDHGSQGCKGGSVNRVFNWGKRKGFITEECYQPAEKGVCPANHLLENECRKDSEIFKVAEYCLAKGIPGIKHEIMRSGPVLGQLTPFTDFLTYSEGTYRRTADAFKYNGNHLVKIIGWETNIDGSSAWIIENNWGPTWGEDGFAKVLSNGETPLDFFGLSVKTFPQSIKKHQAELERRRDMEAAGETISSQQTYTMNDDEEIVDIDYEYDSTRGIDEPVDDEL